MFNLTYVKSNSSPEPITEGFVLYDSSFPDINGHYTELPLGEYEYYDQLFEHLVDIGQLESTACDGIDSLNTILFNGKCYILYGAMGTRVLPIGGNGTNNWYYEGGVGGGAESIDSYYTEEGPDIWAYNVSPGITSNPQRSQDWTQNIFPHIQYPDNN